MLSQINFIIIAIIIIKKIFLILLFQRAVL